MGMPTKYEFICSCDVWMFVGDVMIFIVKYLLGEGLKNYRMDLQSINGAGNMSMVSSPGIRFDTSIVAHRWHNFIFMPGKIETPKPSPSAKIIHFGHDMTVNRK